VSKPETPAQKSIRRRRQIDRRDDDNKKARAKYAEDTAYRNAKLEAARRQTAALNTHQKGLNSERRCAKRFRDRQSLVRSSWNKDQLATGSVILLQELMNPRYIIEHDGKRESERWPPNDMAQFWLSDAAAVASVPRGRARLRSLTGCCGPAGEASPGSLSA
jgi:hypothetical protein